MMAPTEVLARQYEKSLGPLLDQAGVTWETVTGSTPAREREAVLERAAAGTVDVLFGTQALLEDDVRTPCCSLVVIDEQQRFGVAQREALVRKGVAPDVLTMTATPIPRSLALGHLRRLHAFVPDGTAAQPCGQHHARARPLFSGRSL